MIKEPFILLIETSTRICSVAVSKGDELLSVVESGLDNDHAANITVYIDQVLTQAAIKASDLSAIAVSIGPGSYTGLRIGLSTAKGLCYALHIPLIAISTLQSFANHVVKTNGALNPDDRICPLMDARRMEVFTAMFNPSLELLTPPFAHILTEDSFKSDLDKHIVHFVGNGMAKAKELLKNSINAKWYDDFDVSATTLIEPAMRHYRQGSFADLAYSEPFYLKEFIAGTPKVKGLT